MRELLARIDSREMTEWMAYFKIEPFGPLQEDYRAGSMCATIANVYRGKDADPFKAEDFMPSLKATHESSDEPILVNDPEAQSKLIMAAVFKKTD